jgi:hypothetical protein
MIYKLRAHYTMFRYLGAPRLWAARRAVCEVLL